MSLVHKHCLVYVLCGLSENWKKYWLSNYPVMLR